MFQEVSEAREVVGVAEAAHSDAQRCSRLGQTDRERYFVITTGGDVPVLKDALQILGTICKKR